MANRAKVTPKSTLATLIRAREESQSGKGAWTTDDKIVALEMLKKGLPANQIATALGRPEVMVKRWLGKYRSSTLEARITLEAGAADLARRIVRKADVDQSLEVMDRLGVMHARDKGSGTPAGPSFNLIIGVKGAGTPLPDPVKVQKAIEGVVVSNSEDTVTPS